MKTYQDFLKDYQPDLEDNYLKEMSFGYFLSFYLNKLVDKRLSLKALDVSILLDYSNDIYHIATLAENYTQEEYEKAIKRFNMIQEEDSRIYSIEATLWFNDGSYSLYEEDYSTGSYHWKYYPIVPEFPSKTIL